MNPKNILITGLPRSGTTLLCHLLNKAVNTVALHEPLPVMDFQRELTIDGICVRIDSFFAGTRRSLLEKGTAPSRHVNGKVPDNPFNANPGAGGLRKSIQDEVTPIIFNKPLDENMVLAVKHTAAFAALLDGLAPRFNCWAVVRNPLSVLMSWQTVDIPINRGRIPAAEAFSPELKALLDDEEDVLKRQITILQWLFGRFAAFLPPDRIIRYETIITSGGACLAGISPTAAVFREPLTLQNRNPLYPEDLYEKVGKKLLDSPGPAWQFYTREEVEKIIHPSRKLRHNSTIKGSESLRVNFLIIGAQKCGTSALAHFLAQHPEICIPSKKELHFFNSPQYSEHRDSHEIAKLYHRHFPNPAGRSLTGEATPAYVFLPFVPQRVHAYNPDMKLICLLRDPAARAWSQYRMELARGTERRGFWHSILREWLQYRRDRDNYLLLTKSKPLRRFCYLERGLYNHQISRWLTFFHPSQLLLIPTEDLRNNHEATLKGIYEFLQVNDRKFMPKKEIIFSTEGEESPGFFTRIALNLYFRRDRIKLKELTGLDLKEACLQEPL
ncbi:MAG: sulfotransferase [Syntrophales bacterium]|nr:sulfotransferase [Syntrophales bacterium]